MATTTNYSWTTPDNTAYVKDGANAIRTLGSSVDTTLFTAIGGAYAGLRLIKKQTVGNAVASVSVTSAFSATYENYKIVYSAGVSSTSNILSLSLNGSTTAYYNFLIYGSYSAATVLGITNSNGALWNYMGAGNTNGAFLDVDLSAPFLTKNTFIKSSHAQNTTTGAAGSCSGYINDSLSSTGFTISAATGTITGGTIYVYGYGAS